MTQTIHHISLQRPLSQLGVKVHLPPAMKLRIWIGKMLIAAAARIVGCGVEIEVINKGRGS